MKQTRHVLEYSRPTVSREVIHGVKIIGLQSSHGYGYPAGVLRRAAGLYESAPVFVSHPDPREKRRGTRLLRDHFGSLENVTCSDSGLFGDLAVRSSHPLAAQILEEAPTASFGLSHNAVVEMSDDGKSITNIVEVNSVDLVDDPATTKNLFEEDIMPEEKAESPDAGEGEAGKEGSFEDKVLAFMAKMLAYIEPKDANLVKDAEAAGAAQAEASEGRDQKPPKRLVALENRDELAIGNTHEDFLGAVRGFQLK